MNVGSLHWIVWVFIVLLLIFVANTIGIIHLHFSLGV